MTIEIEDVIDRIRAAFIDDSVDTLFSEEKSIEDLALAVQRAKESVINELDLLYRDEETARQVSGEDLSN